MKRVFNSQKGFTLVELLIVIAILGVLAAGLLTVLDPLEQIQRGRDATRISQVNQLGNAMTAYFVAQQAYPPLNEDTWITSLVDAGELKQASPNNASDHVCNGNTNMDEKMQNKFCYFTNGSGSTARAIVYVAMESKSQRVKANCGIPAAPARASLGEGNTWFVWSSVYGKSGLVCSTSNAEAWNSGPPIDNITFK